MSLCNFKCAGKSCSWGQKGFFDGVADSFVDFPPSLPFADLSGGVCMC